MPVMGHLGLTPQHVHRLGGMRRQSCDGGAADELVRDAIALQDSGIFAPVLEAVPRHVAEAVTSKLKIPTIGIGAGPHCDGQVLVSYDMLGLFDGFRPPFVKQYAKIGELIIQAATRYRDEVHNGTFPEVDHARLGNGQIQKVVKRETTTSPRQHVVAGTP